MCKRTRVVVILCSLCRLEHRNREHNFSHLLPNPEDWPAVTVAVGRFGRTLDVCSNISCHRDIIVLYLCCSPCDIAFVLAMS